MALEAVAMNSSINISEQATFVNEDNWLFSNLEYIYIESPTERDVFIAEMSILSCIGVLGNSLLVAVFVDRIKKITATTVGNKYNYLTACLAVADLFVCGFCIPFSLASRLQIISQQAVCQFMEFLSLVALCFTILLTVGVAVERFYAVMRPTDPFTSKHTWIVIGSIAIISVVCNIPAILLSSVYAYSSDIVVGCHLQVERSLGFYYVVSLALFVTGVSITTLVIYSLLFKMINHQLSAKHQGRLHAKPASSHTDSKTHTLSDTDEKDRTHSLNQTNRLQHKISDSNARSARVVFMLFGVTVVFFATWLPYVLTAFRLIPNNVCLVYMLYINNSTRFITYGVMNEKIRSELISKMKAPCARTKTAALTS